MTTRSRLRKRSARRKRNELLIWSAIIGAVATVLALSLVQRANLPGERFASQGNVHIRDVDTPHVPYNSDPPTSGAHVGNLAPWGSYDTLLPDELLVHNLEDGGVILYYALGTPEENEAEIEALEDVARGFHRVVIAPRESMPTRYALTAWQRLQRYDEIDADAMRAFIDAFHGVDHH
jgi:hypothetical protein